MLTREEGFDILVETAATVVADVDDDALLLVILAHHVGVDGAEAGVAHRGNVYVAECALRDALYLFGALLNPALIEKITEGRRGDWTDDFVYLLARSGAEGDEETLTYLVIEQREVVLSWLERHAIDARDEATLLELRARSVEGTSCYDFIDVQSTRASHGGEEEP